MNAIKPIQLVSKNGDYVVVSAYLLKIILAFQEHVVLIPKCYDKVTFKVFI